MTRRPRRPVDWAERILAAPSRAERRRLLERVPEAYRAEVRWVVEQEFKRRKEARR